MSFIIGIMCGLDNTIGNDFTLSRIIVFYQFNEQSIDFDELKNCILKEISNEDNCKKALEKLEKIEEMQKENTSKQVMASTLIDLKNFLISIVISLSASLIQLKIGI